MSLRSAFDRGLARVLSPGSRRDPLVGGPCHHRGRRRRDAVDVLWECFRDLRDRPETERGRVRDLGLRWRRERYGDVDFAALDDRPARP